MFLYVFVAPHSAYIWLSSAVHSVVVKQLFTVPWPEKRLKDSDGCPKRSHTQLAHEDTKIRELIRSPTRCPNPNCWL